MSKLYLVRVHFRKMPEDFQANTIASYAVRVQDHEDALDAKLKARVHVAAMLSTDCLGEMKEEGVMIQDGLVE